MSGTPLELAAFACLAVAAVALMVHFSRRSFSSYFSVLRFRRKLKGLDAVLGTWAEQTRRHDPHRQPRRVEPESRLFGHQAHQLDGGEEEPPAAAAAC